MLSKRQQQAMFQSLNSKFKPATVPKDIEDGAREPMLNQDESSEMKSQMRKVKFWNASTPWILTTLILSLYIALSSLKAETEDRTKSPLFVWRPNELGRYT